MKRFFLKLICYALALLILPLSYFVYIQSLPRVYGGLVGSIRTKTLVLQQTQGPRVIIAGGSSAAYSVNCEEIAQAFSMPCVNMGATAYFGLELYMSVILPELQAGDIVILAPEFNIYDGTLSPSLVWGGIENDISLLLKLPLSYAPKLLSSYHLYAKQKLSLQKEKLDPDTEGYKAFGFGEFGDITTERGNILESKYNTQDMHNITSNSLSRSLIAAVNRFYAAATQKGASVYWTAAPINRLSLTSELEDLDILQARFQNECKVPVIGFLRDGVMDEELFFDSNFHLNSNGMSEYTSTLIYNLMVEQMQEALAQGANATDILEKYLQEHA